MNLFNMTLLNFHKHFKYVISKFIIKLSFIKKIFHLKVQLEEIRNSENELRWKPEEDFTECQRCHLPFSVTWRKHHCRKLKHSGIIFLTNISYFSGHCGKFPFINFNIINAHLFFFIQEKFYVKNVPIKLFTPVHIIEHAAYATFVIHYW